MAAIFFFQGVFYEKITVFRDPVSKHAVSKFAVGNYPVVGKYVVNGIGIDRLFR